MIEEPIIIVYVACVFLCEEGSELKVWLLVPGKEDFIIWWSFWVRIIHSH